MIKKFLDTLSVLIPFLQAYPIWVQALVSIWILFTAMVIISLLFGKATAPQSSNQIPQEHPIQVAETPTADAHLPASPNLNSQDNVSKQSAPNTKELPLRSESSKDQNIRRGLRPRLWITYAWKDNAGGNFDFLVSQLEAAGVDTTFDKVALIPGRRLWDQIAARIEDPELNGWAILLTQESIKSEACKEELAYALDRALSKKSENFPLFGLLHQVNVQEVPAPLRARLLIDMQNPQWPQLVVAGLKGVPPEKAPTTTTRYIWKTILDFRGQGTLAITVNPRFGELHYWRFIYPQNAKVIDWGHGPPQQQGFSGAMTMTVEGWKATMKFPSGEEPVICLGSGDAITPGWACYIVFSAPLPKFVAFATANEPLGPPTAQTLEIFPIR
jgi:hypothetical protein